MHVAAQELTRLVRIVYDDGTETEVEMTEGMAKALRRMDWAEQQRERRSKCREVTFTDAGISPAAGQALADHAQHKRTKARTQGNPWEGPKVHFRLLLGYSAVWSGPESLRVSGDGGKTWTCRFCGHIKRLPGYACCLNPDCCRTGVD